MIYIASDHGGFQLKQKIINYLMSKKIDIKDMGATEYNENDDYTDYVIPMVKEILTNPKNKGIALCRSGDGVNITANRFKGIRSTLSWNKEHAAKSKIDDDTNVLAIPTDYIEESAAIEMVDTWLNTEFSALPRYIRRIKKMENI
jgi:ribose 5-phosphate isomerase B